MSGSSDILQVQTSQCKVQILLCLGYLSEVGSPAMFSPVSMAEAQVK